METQHWLDIARDCGYLSSEVHRELLDRCTLIGGMLQRMQEKAAELCSR
ncbi:four helix bundle protein [bacterium]|nr:four helix bundle protein [bacterium]